MCAPVEGTTEVSSLSSALDTVCTRAARAKVVRTAVLYSVRRFVLGFDFSAPTANLWIEEEVQDTCVLRMA